MPNFPGIGSTKIDFGTRANSDIRVAFISPGIAPYRVPVVARINQLANVELELIFALQPTQAVLELLERNRPQLNYQCLPSRVVYLRTKRGDRAALYFTPQLWQYLVGKNYDVVVTLGWTFPNSILALLYGKRYHRPVVLWEETIPHPLGFAKRLLLPLLRRYVGAYSAYLAASHGCIDYLEMMGAPRSRITLMPQIADNEFFASTTTTLRRTRDVLKRELGVQTSQVILFVGQFTQRKGVLTLLDSFRQIAQTHPDVSMMLVGEGPLRQELETRREAYELHKRVFVVPFVTQARLPRYYAAADIFVLPSRYDTFGVVISEAMASGLPIVTTHNVGATTSIVHDGVNGLIVPPNSAPALTGALRRLLDDEPLRSKMGAESLRIISGWNAERAAENFAECLALCLGQPNLRGNALPTKA